MIVYMFLGVWLVICSNLTVGRRYDVELEAIKLYGEPLAAVIARLRRTPEYQDILTDCLSDLKMERDNFAIFLLESYRIKLIERLEAMYNVNSTSQSSTGLRSLSWPRKSRHHRRQGVEYDQNITNYLEEAVHRLDNHPILHHELSVDERNRLKDMGFELAGEYLHSVISSMEPSDVPQPSTQQPWGDSGVNYNITTKHSHVVTQPTPVTIYLNELNATRGTMTSPPKYYKQRQRFF